MGAIFITTEAEAIADAKVLSICGDEMKRFISSDRFTGKVTEKFPTYLTASVGDLLGSLESWKPSFMDKRERLYLIDQLRQRRLRREDEISIGAFILTNDLGGGLW